MMIGSIFSICGWRGARPDGGGFDAYGTGRLVNHAVPEHCESEDRDDARELISWRLAKFCTKTY